MSADKLAENAEIQHIYVKILIKCHDGTSSVGIVTRNRLDGPGIESWLGRDFPHPSGTSYTVDTG